MKRDKVTLRDVAKQAGVSVGSVSRYLNQHPSLSGKAKDAIAEAIKKLNYTPNQMARRLATGVSGNLFLYINQEYPIFNTTWLFELPIIHGIFEQLKNTNYSLQIAIGSVFDHARCKEDIFRLIDSGQVDGILILSSWPLDKSVLVRLIDSGFPYALIGNANQIDDVNSIVCDNERAVAELTSMLCDLGHRDIAFLGGYDSQLHTRERCAGYRRALSGRGMKVRPELVRYGDYSFESGVALMDELLSGDPPTAVVAGNDFIAAGVMRSIKKHGLKVPRNISVTGFDNVTVASIVEPGLTTVRMPQFEMGRLAAERLIAEIDGKNCVFPSETLRCDIVVRESIAKVERRQ